MATEPIWNLDRVSLDPARLRDVSLEIHAGITAVIGWSGAGKTSLLNLLAGFEKPHRGTLTTRAPGIGWVPQNGGLWPHCTAREHLKIARRSDTGIDDLLAAFDLAEKGDARPDALSEGEQSRLSVARALATNAAALVMDEPLVHVDPARAGKYWSAIRAHIARTGASLIFSTHVPETALAEAGRAVCLREGRVLHEAPIADLYARPPTPELMNFLGPGNWLTPDDARLWFGVEIESASCFRPEQIEIEPASNGGLFVESASFRGSVSECVIRRPDQTSHRFFHRPAAPMRAGQSVRLSAR